MELKMLVGSLKARTALGTDAVAAACARQGVRPAIWRDRR